MEEIFELIRAFNKLRDKVMEFSDKIDQVIKFALQPPPGDYLEEHFACKFLHISKSTLIRLRNAKTIPYSKYKKKVLYKKSDLEEFLRKKR